MRRRRGIFLQKAMAVLLSALLCVGLIVGAGPMDAWAEEETPMQTAYLIVEFDGSTEVPSVSMDVCLKDDNNKVYSPSSSSKAGSVTYKVENLLPNEQYYWIIDGTTIPFKRDSSEYTVVRTLYSVKYMDGNTVLYTQYVAYGGKAQPPSNPTKPGYTFVGWRTTNSTSGTEFPFGTRIITESTKIYAAWKRIVTDDALSQLLNSALNQIAITNGTTEADIINYVKSQINKALDIESTVTIKNINRTAATSTSGGLVELKVSVTYGGCAAEEERSISTPKEGKDWTLKSNGYLTISSQEGMNDWANNGGRTNNLSDVKTVDIGYKVTIIPDNAFNGCDKLQTVYPPYNLKSIGNSAFAGASSLSVITLPSNIESIGRSAFSGCSSLKKVTMQGSTPPTFMGDSIFDGCKFVTDSTNADGIVVPSGSGKAYEGAVGAKFAQFVKEETPAPAPKPQVTESALSEKLQEILNELPVSNSTTMDAAMRDVKKKLDDYFSNKSTIQAGYYALTRANYEKDGLIVLEMTALCGSYSVTKQVTKSVPKLDLVLEEAWILDEDGNLVISGQKGMGDWVNNGRTEENLPAVKNVLLWGNVTEIPDNAFSGCGNLEYVSISETVTSIGNSAFAGASSLGEVTLPPNLQVIGDGAFSDCSSLKKVVMQGSTPPTIGNSVFEGCKFVTDSVEGIVVPPGTAEEYNKAAGGTWGAYIAGGSPTVTDAALSSKLKEVFEELSVSNDVKLETVRDAVKEAIDAHFRINSVITIAGFEISNATIENDGFLKLIVTVKDEESSSFAQAEGIIPIPKLPPLPDRGWTLDEAGNLVIGNQAGMDDWTSSGRAEGKFPAVKNISIQSGVTSIPDDAFSGCCDLETVVIPDTVTSIGSLAFKHASSLCEITLPPNLQSIGDSAFSDCNSLEKVVMQGNTPPSLGDSVFDQCKFVTDSSRGIVVPKGTEDAYKAAWGSLGANILEKHTHSYEAEWTYDDTGHWHECACGVKEDMDAHAWDGGTVTKEPTEVEPGAMNYMCSVCGMEKTESIPATGSGGGQGGTGDGGQGGMGEGTPSVSGNGNQGGDGNGSVSGNDNPSGGNTSVSGNDNPGGDSVGDSPSIPGDSNQGGRSGGGDPQLPEDNSSDLTLLWNTLTANAPKDAEPRTADGVPLELYATVAMIAGFCYLLLLFLDKYDITEEKRRESLARLVRWAKCGGWLRKLPVMAVLLLMRTYYRIVGGQQSKEKKI